MSRPLLFSMGFNGYQRIYRRNVASQRRYAERCAMHYEFLARPLFTPLLMECCWLKVPLIVSALDRGWPWVAYIDCDVEVRDDCPDFRTLEEEGKSLYMADGYSGRLNSGVIIVKNTPSMRALFLRIYRAALEGVPPEDDVGWGENGHIIHFAKNHPELSVISRKWNNNSDPTLDDYMRHYSSGPMRKLYTLDASERAWTLLGKAYLKGARSLVRAARPTDFFANVASLYDAATAGSASFVRAPELDRA